MRYVNKFDYILENMAQARAILTRKNISYDNPTFQKILAATKRDGYTGLITRIVFELPLDVDSALRLYDTMKEAKIDVGDKEIKRILDNEDLTDMRKVTEIITYIKEERIKTKKSYEYLFTDNNYRVYLINNYQGILATASPAWCLKTKSMFDNYTTQRNGTQFVIINERFVGKDDEFLLTVPNTWHERYESGSYAKMRLGITIYPTDRMILFDDNNTQIDCYQNTLTDPRYDFLKPLLSRLLEYYKQNIKTETIVDVDFEEFSDKVNDILDELRMLSSFTSMAQKGYKDIDDKFKEFFDKIEQKMSLNKEQFLDLMVKFKYGIMTDDNWINKSGYKDMLINFMLTHENPEIGLEECSNITEREHPLGGYFFDEQEGYDLIIKYSYGYQYTKYGIAAIEQGFGTVRNFYGRLTSDFAEQLINGEYTSVSALSDIDLVDLEECLIKKEEMDGYEIKIDCEKLCNLLEGDMSSAEINDDIKEIIAPSFKGVTRSKDYKYLIVPIYTQK